MMARRPVFLPTPDGGHLVEERLVEFEWFPGMAASQKQKSIRSLHAAAMSGSDVREILEISSKSEAGLGVALSAFNLVLPLREGSTTTVECAFQGSKVFERSGPHVDLYQVDPRDARRDPRLAASGALTAFEFLGTRWPLSPKTAFYDWLYTRALQRFDDAGDLLRFEAFTDIEFNPQRSVNCQARAAARFVALARRGLLPTTVEDPELFLDTYREQERLI